MQRTRQVFAERTVGRNGFTRKFPNLFCGPLQVSGFSRNLCTAGTLAQAFLTLPQRLHILLYRTFVVIHYFEHIFERAPSTV